ncbi:cell envelope-related transcriptional attenuator [Olsenella uli DSM 7084]|nr:LCP family protein [Olsenella uli]KRO12028.1 cell envelope-related transcriptional attenuator [Olsenella uli DSM 7084]
MSGEDLASDAERLSRARAAKHYAQANLKRRHRRRRIVGAIVGVFAALLLGAGGAAWAYINNINQRLGSNIDPKLRQTLESATAQDPGDPFYMLLLGIDKDEGRAEGSEYGSSDSAYRSDSIMLVRVDPKNKKATLVSIHRDTLVDLGEHGKQKINAAYSIGGAAYATEVISQFAGVPISHYAEVDMDGMAAVVNAVGGVTVDLPVPVRDPGYTGLDLPAGEQTLDGQTAALLCRARHAYDSYGDGDVYRAANQRSVIAAVVKKVLGSDLATMTATVSAMADMVNTDMNVSSILSLATQFSGMDADTDILTGMAPTTSRYQNDTWYELCDTNAWRAMMERVDQGLSPYEDASSDLSSGVSAQSADQTSTEKAPTSDSSASPTGEAADGDKAVLKGTVTVVNASTTDGVAGDAATRLSGVGFTASAQSAGVVSETTHVYYNGDGKAAARGVVQTLGLGVTAEPNDGTQPTGTDVVVVLGTDTN